MNKRILFLLLLFATIGTQAAPFTDYLTPQPQRISLSDNYIVNYPYQLTEMQNFLGQLRQGNFEPEAVFHYSGQNIINLRFITNEHLKAQHYVLSIAPGEITIAGGDEAALFYGAQTLSQIIEYALSEQAPLPCLIIEDWPDFSYRGFMLDKRNRASPQWSWAARVVAVWRGWSGRRKRRLRRRIPSLAHHPPLL